MFELVPRTTFSPLSKLRRQMDDLWSNLLEGEPAAELGPPLKFTPFMDVKETPEAYEVSLEVPGLKPEQIQVSLSGDLLTIKGEKKEEQEKKNGDFHLVERRFGSFQRTLRLPNQVDHKKLSATQTNGVLKITLPKGQKETLTNVKIEAG